MGQKGRAEGGRQEFLIGLVQVKGLLLIEFRVSSVLVECVCVCVCVCASSSEASQAGDCVIKATRHNRQTLIIK